MKLTGKVAIVRGGDTGIGKAISVALAREGTRVVIDYHGDKKLAEELVSHIENVGGNAIASPAEMSKPDEVEQLVRDTAHACGGLDILGLWGRMGRAILWEVD